MVKTMYEPLVSVIVPVYNVYGYVEKCVESILVQSYRNLEVILVDDGSTDGSGEICDCYAARDGRVAVIHKVNGGLVSARKAGVLVAKGEYTLNVDGDDWIDKDRILHAVEKLQEEKHDMVYIGGVFKEYEGSTQYVYGNCPCGVFTGNEIVSVVFEAAQNTASFYGRDMQISVCGSLMRTDFYRKHQMQVDDRVTMCEDILCIFLCLLDASSVVLFVDDSYHYVQRELESMCYTPDIHAGGRIAIVYRTLKEAFARSRRTLGLARYFLYAMYYSFLMADYASCLFEDDVFLFPFSRVSRGSRIVVWGAGKIGRRLIASIAHSGDYDIVLWCDNDFKRPAQNGISVSNPDALHEADFDFIVVATIFADNSAKIKKRLLSMGVQEYKIATIDQTVLTEDRLNRIYERARLSIPVKKSS
ncbi:MAG: glycosyltransferase [Treponema sp.]|nr:glycosyltransferase [Treponema sp.]